MTAEIVKDTTKIMDEQMLSLANRIEVQYSQKTVTLFSDVTVIMLM